MPLLTTTDQLLNTSSPAYSAFSDVLALSDGRFIAVWESGTSESEADISARLFTADGHPTGPEFTLNTTTLSNQARPQLAELSNGNIVATWFDGDTGFIQGRILQVNALSDPDFALTSETSNDGRSGVTALSNGGFALVWDHSSGLGVPAEIHVQIFDADGVQVGGQINTTLSVAHSENTNPIITELADGRLLLSWLLIEPDPFFNGNVYGRILNANGSVAGSEFKMNSTTSDVRAVSETVALPGGGFITLFVTDEGVNGNEVRARIFNAAGSATGADFLVNDVSTGNQTGASIAVLQDGRFLVTWQTNEGGQFDIHARLFNAGGGAAGASFIVNSTTVSNQTSSRVTATVDGRFVVTWDSSDTGKAERFAFVDPDNFQGTAGQDAWTGGAQTDHLYGYNGSDTLRGGGGDDFVFGGLGTDQLQGNSGNDRIDGGAGGDSLSGGSGNDVIKGGQGVDIIVGDTGDDTLMGGIDGDSLNGGVGADTASYRYDKGVKTSLDGTYTNVTRTGAANGDTYQSIENLEGSDGGRDTLVGNASVNVLSGLGGADSLIGRAGNDKLNGGAGRDILVGGTGRDTLTGGADRDTYRFYAPNEGGDKIALFEAGEKISFKGAAFGGLAAGALSASLFRSGLTNTGDANDRFIFRTTDDTLWYDSNAGAAGGAILIADFVNDFNSFSASDIVIF